MDAPPPRVRIAPGDLAGLDALEAEALLLPLFEVFGQPGGVAGFTDWRLCGRLAGLVRTRRFEGRSGEAVLASSLGRLPVSRIFLYGLGPPRVLSGRDVEPVITPALEVVARAGARKIAIGPHLPPEPGDEAAVQAARLWIEAAIPLRERLEEVVILDASGVLERGRVALGEVLRDRGLELAG